MIRPLSKPHLLAKIALIFLKICSKMANFSNQSRFRKRSIKPKVHGLQVNLKTGCKHYNSPTDIVAIKFKCCEEYYSCYSCHLAIAKHSVERWKHSDLDKRAILCGHCGMEMTIRQYLFGDSKCLTCNSQFNTKCRLHWNLYFEEPCFCL